MRFFFAPRLEFSPSANRPSVAVLLAAALWLGVTTPSSAQISPGEPLIAPANEPGDVNPLSEELASEPSAPDRVVDEVNSANSLLDALSESEDGREADALARQVQSAWNDSGSESVNLLMRRASVAIQMQNYPRALDLLDTVIALAPDYSEGWNRRATVHFLREDFGLSIADVQRVLRLEPRHFGALSGMGIMLDQLGNDEAAQLFLSEALKVHPYLTTARERLDAIERRLRGSAI